MKVDYFTGWPIRQQKVLKPRITMCRDIAGNVIKGKTQILKNGHQDIVHKVYK
jgi:hypothetical protein